MFAVETARRLVIEEAFAAQSRHRHQPIAAEPVDRREEAEGLHPGDARGNDLALLGRKISRDITVDGFAFGLHRAAFERADRLADARQTLGRSEEHTSELQSLKRTSYA